MNSWRSPQGVRFRHFPDQISHLGAHSGTAGSPAPGDPGPVKPEPSSRPAHDRLWVDNQQGPSPVTPTLDSPTQTSGPPFAAEVSDTAVSSPPVADGGPDSPKPIP